MSTTVHTAATRRAGRGPSPVARSLPATWSDVAQVRLCLAALVVVVAVTGCHVLHVSATDATVVAGVVTVVAGPRLVVRHGLAVAGVGWAWVTGFVANTGGQLTFGGHDLVRAAALGGCALLAAALVTRRSRVR